MNRSLTCETLPLEALVAAGLHGEEEAAVERHLAECEACAGRLEGVAAPTDWWSEARQHLSGDDEGLSPDATIARVAALLAPTDDPRMMGRLGGYEVAGIVGEGGMGIVLKAFDAALSRYVAIKMLAPHLAQSGAARQRFAREARAAASVVHDNVIEIYGVAQWRGLPYLVMPYVRGASLERRLRDCGPLELEEILRIGMQTAEGLAAAHGQGLVHRDVKPANILLADGAERVTLTDFGLARAVDDASLTRSGSIAGTPQYMSPEQARGETVDAQSDLFSLGSVLYAMCTGRPPFRSETSYGVLRRIGEDRPRPIRESNPAIPDWLCRLVRRLHEKSPAERFASAEETAQVLRQCLAHVQDPSQPLPECAAPAAPSSWRRWLAPALAMGTSAALLAALVWPNVRPSRDTLHCPRPEITRGDDSWNDGLNSDIETLEESVADFEVSLPPLPADLSTP